MAFIEGRLRNDDTTIVRAPDLIRWGAVIAGGIVGLGLFALLNTLWLAIASGSGDGWVSGNLAWFVGATRRWRSCSAAGSLGCSRGFAACWPA